MDPKQSFLAILVVESRVLAAELGKSRQVGWQPAIMESRLLAAEPGKSKQVEASGLTTSNRGIVEKYYREEVRILQAQALFGE